MSILCAWIKRTAKGGIFYAFCQRFFKTSFFVNYETMLGGFIFLMFILPHNYWSNSFALAAAIGLFIIYQFMVASGARKQLYIHDLGLPITLFAIVCIANPFLSFAKGDSVRVLLMYITAFIFLYLVVADIDSKKKLMKFAGFIYWAVILTSLYAFYQRMVGVEIDPSLIDTTINKGVPGRVYSTLDNPNNYAEFLILMTPIAACFAANVKRETMRLPLCLGIALPALAMLMTYSRTGWVSTAVTCFVFIYYSNKRLLPWLIFAGVALIPFLPASIITRFTTIFNPADHSTSFRVYILMGVIGMLRDFGLMGIGLGPGSFALLYPNYAVPEAMEGPMHSHMVYVELILELGILGFVAFMWFLLKLLKDSSRVQIHSQDKTIKYFTAAVISSIVGISVAFFTEYVWYYPRVLFAYFILCGIALALMRIEKQNHLIQSKGSQK